jgi:hypothetical protein
MTPLDAATAAICASLDEGEACASPCDFCGAAAAAAADALGVPGMRAEIARLRGASLWDQAALDALGEGLRVLRIALVEADTHDALQLRVDDLMLELTSATGRDSND